MFDCLEAKPSLTELMESGLLHHVIWSPIFRDEGEILRRHKRAIQKYHPRNPSRTEPKIFEPNVVHKDVEIPCPAQSFQSALEALSLACQCPGAQLSFELLHEKAHKNDLDKGFWMRCRRCQNFIKLSDARWIELAKCFGIDREAVNS